MGVIKFSTGKARRKGVTAANKKKAESAKPKVNRGVPKQKIEAKAKRLSAVKALQKEQKERAKKRKVAAVKTKKTVKKALKSAGRVAKRADKFAIDLFKGFKW